jgi:hypothetical protein
MAVVRNLILRAGADFSGMSKGMKKAQRDIRKFKRSFNNTAKQVLRISTAIATATVYASIKAMQAADAENEAHVKLTTVMKQRMKATDGMVKSVIDLASEQQKSGVIGDDVLVSGAQQLATFLNQTESLHKLIPAMGNLAAQQKGVNATSGDLVNIGNMMGKVFTGQVGALTRVGISFTKAQEEILKFGSESEKAATLAQVITDNVGEMNKALANTDAGRLAQLKNEFNDLQEFAGRVVMPIRNVLIPATRNLIEHFRVLLERMKPAVEMARVFLETLFNVKAVKSANAAAGAVSNQGDAYEDLGEAAKKTKKQLMGFDEINQLQEDSEESAYAAADASYVSANAMLYENSVVAELGDTFVLTADQIKKATEKAAEFRKTLEGVKEFLTGFLTGLYENIDDLWIVKLFNFLFKINLSKTNGDLEETGKQFGEMAIQLGNLYLAVKTLEGVSWFMGLLGVKKGAFGGLAAVKAFLLTPLGLIIAAALGMATIKTILGVDPYDRDNSGITTAPEEKKTPIPKELQPTTPWKPAPTPTAPHPQQGMLMQHVYQPAGASMSVDFKAGGGFLDRGQMFVANEMGAEMVGSMDGKSAVANNEQIVEGIKRGVMEAMQSSSQTFKLQIGSTEFEQVVSKTMRDYSRRTGGAFA